MDQNTYVRQRMGSLEHHDDIPASELDHFISNMAFNAPLFILTSGESHDDMHSLLSETTDSVFFDKMRKTHFKNDPDYEDKLDVVRERLSSELDRVANKLGWWIGDEAAEMLTVTLKSGYPHHTYHVFPVFLRGTREAPGSGSLKTTIPWW